MAVDLGMGLIWYVIFLFSLTCHEAAHALAAKLGGDLTAYHGGQVSLDPLPHIRRAPFGTVLVPILSYLWSGWMFGWANAPYDLEWQRRYPKRAAWMAAAGPAANFALVILAAIAIHAGMLSGIFEPPSQIVFSSIVAGTTKGLPSVLATFVSILFSLNLLLAVFNLIPAPPLDGSAAIGIFLDEQTALKVSEFMRNPSLSLLGILIAWQVIQFVYFPALKIAITLLYPDSVYNWD